MAHTLSGAVLSGSHHRPTIYGPGSDDTPARALLSRATKRAGVIMQGQRGTDSRVMVAGEGPDRSP
jgi:hypothetical protein